MLKKIEGKQGHRSDLNGTSPGGREKFAERHSARDLVTGVGSFLREEIVRPPDNLPTL
jgi:hypothetical protein